MSKQTPWTVGGLVDRLSKFSRDMLVAIPGVGVEEDNDVSPGRIDIRHLWSSAAYPGIYKSYATLQESGLTASVEVVVISPIP